MTSAAPVKMPLLSEQQRQAIHDGALRILEQIGLEIESESLRNTLAAYNGVTLRHRRALFDPDLIERLLERPEPQPWTPTAVQRVSLGSGDGMFHIVDAETDVVRPMTWDDAVEGTKLVDAMRSVDVFGGCPGTPQDIAPEMFALAEFAIGAL